MHVSNLDEMRHTFYFGSNDFGPNGFGPYEIDPSSDRGHIRVDRPHDCKEITITVSTCPNYTFYGF